MNERASYCSVEEASASIACCLSRNITFYACRYPHEQECRFGAQVATLPLHEIADGFRVVPFDMASDVPAFTIQPDRFAADIDTLRAMPHSNLPLVEMENTDIDIDRYTREVDRLVARMQQGELSKVVFSRTITQACEAHSLMPHFFERLCNSYPSAYVFMVYYPSVCAWVGATPEVLLLSQSNGYATMALAGTRRADTAGLWGKKEQEEQQYVSHYVADILHQQGFDNVTRNTYTHKAGQVEHLCTHFDITTPLDSVVRDHLVAHLHPTPAVAGTPTHRAIEAIGMSEHHARRYYAGYVGECCADGRCGFYVNLRSMEFSSSAVRLYVGGGLTAQSVALDEWNETCAKSQTLLSVLNQ